MPAPDKPQVEPAVLEDWGGFKVAMLQNQAYATISELSREQAAVRRLETFFSVQGEQLEVAVGLWKLMINGLPEDERPNAFDVGQWRAITRATHMPITFDDEGLLQVVSDDS